jgi:hypothetical protein
VSDGLLPMGRRTQTMFDAAGGAPRSPTPDTATHRVDQRTDPRRHRATHDVSDGLVPTDRRTKTLFDPPTLPGLRCAN